MAKYIEHRVTPVITLFSLWFNYSLMPFLQRQCNYTTVVAWMKNHTALFHVGVITYTFLKFNTTLAKSCYHKRSQVEIFQVGMLYTQWMVSWHPFYYHRLNYIREWMGNYIHCCICNFNGGLLKSPLAQVRAWVTFYIPIFDMYVITYPCPYPGAGLTNP